MSSTDLARRLQAVRYALGISAGEMGDVLGLDRDGGERQVLAMESGRALPEAGPVARVLRYVEQAVDIAADARLADLTDQLLPRWLDCMDLEDDENPAELIFHTRFPRFLGIIVDDVEDTEALSAAGVPYVEFPDYAALGGMIVLFIDSPVRDPTSLIQEAAALKLQQAMRDLDAA